MFYHGVSDPWFSALDPLCPYPSYAHYTGAGDPADAANFECRTPAD